jgi:hypothetical protein
MFVAGLVFAAGLIGYLLGELHTVKMPEPTSAVPMQREARDPEWLHGLQADMRALTEQLRNAPRAVSERAPATPGHDDSPALRALLGRLEAQIALLESGAVTAHVAPAVATPGLMERLDQESLKFAWQAESGFGAGYDDWTTELEKELTRAHELWTLDQVLSVYGPAWSVQESNGRIFRLAYPFRRLDDSSSLGIIFQFASERVLHATVDYVDTTPR